MRILVTGGTGAVGRFVCAEIRDRGHDLSVASRRPPRGAIDGEWVEYEAGRDDPHELLARSRPDRVIHLAAIVGAECEADPGAAVSIDGTAVIDLLAAARECYTGRVVVMSSKASYGDMPMPTSVERAWTEDDLVVRPVSAYGIAKAVAEWGAFAAARTHGQDVVVIRAATTVGPGKGTQHGPTASPSLLIEGAAAGQDVVVELGGDQIDDLIYNRDLAYGLVQACLWPDRLPHVEYHLSTGRGITLKDVGAHLERRIPSARIQVGDGYNFHRLDHNLHCVLSYERAQADFGYQPQFPFPLWVDDYLRAVSPDSTAATAAGRGPAR
jgi:UDP-glucose 4-epimerase